MRSRVLRYLAFLTLLAGVHGWLVATGRPTASDPVLLHTFRGHEGPITSLSFSPDGRLLATCSEDQTAKLWDISSGRLQRSLKGHAGTVGSVAFAPGGRTLATGGADGVRLWDVASGRLLRTLREGGYPVAFSPNGRLLAAASGNTVSLWSTRSWQVLTTLRGSDVPPGGPSLGCSVGIGQVAFAPDGKSMATVESVYCGSTPGLPDDFVQLWNTATWRVRRSLVEPPTQRKHVAFAPDSRFLALSSEGIDTGQLLLWDLATGAVRSLATGPDGAALSVAFGPQGRWVAFDSAAGVKFVDVSTGKPILAVKVGGPASFLAQETAVSPDGRLLAAARQDGAVEIWRLPAGLQGDRILARANFPFAARSEGARL